MRKLLLVTLVWLDTTFRIDERLAARNIDCWAHFLEKANVLWPDYDGETFCDLICRR